MKLILHFLIIVLFSSCLTMQVGNSNQSAADVVQPVVGHYSDGKLMYKGQYLNGVPHGTWIELNGNGDTVSILNYRQGELQGPFKKWELEKKYENNTEGVSDYAVDYGEVFRHEGSYLDGKINDSYKVFYSSGLLKTSGNYNKGRMDKKWVGFGASGDTVSIVNYSLGLKKGPFVIWNYLTSEVLTSNVKGEVKIKHEGIFLLNKLNGNYVETYPDGTVRCLGAYIEGNREGEWVWYSSIGVIEETATFKFGVLLKTEKFNEQDY